MTIKKKKCFKKFTCQSARPSIFKYCEGRLAVKTNLVHQLTEATRETNKAFGQISDLIVNVGNSIGNGLVLFARALGGSQQNSNSSYFNQHNSNAMYANQYSNAMQANFPYVTSAMQGSNINCFKNSSTPFFLAHILMSHKLQAAVVKT